MSTPCALVIEGGRAARGSVRTPGEKSISHRSILFAALAEGTSVIHGLSDGADVAATLAAVAAMGVKVERRGDGALVLIGGRSRLHAPSAPIDCGNSGDIDAPARRILGRVRLDQRARGRRFALAASNGPGCHPTRLDGRHRSGRGDRVLPPLRIKGGRLNGIDWTSPIASVQVKSAILLAGLVASGETTVRELITTRTHTEEMLAEAGVETAITSTGEGRIVTVRPSVLRPVERTVPGDPSAAAFFVVAGCVVARSVVDVRSVYRGPARLGFANVLRRMGGQVVFTLDDDPSTGNTTSITTQAGPLVGTEVAAAEIPSLDEVRSSRSPPRSPTG